MKRDRPRLKQAAAAGDLIQALLHRLGYTGKLKRYRAWQVWDEVVGPQIAAHAQPVRLREGILEVRVDQPVWMQQLQLMKPQILARLNHRLGEGEIRDIYWRRGKVTAKTGTQAPAKPRISLGDVHLSEAEQRDIEEAVRKVGEPELQARLRRILQQQARLEKARTKSTDPEENPD